MNADQSWLADIQGQPFLSERRVLRAWPSRTFVQYLTRPCKVPNPSSGLAPIYPCPGSGLVKVGIDTLVLPHARKRSDKNC